MRDDDSLNLLLLSVLNLPPRILSKTGAMFLHKGFKYSLSQPRREVLFAVKAT
jgi:hypothetical protein